MQFKYPELLWALFLLLIPIFIHLFQLRRFKKTPFTNVKLLQKVVSESRKSNTLKKWLLLLTRLMVFAALIMAFTQPFFAKKSALQSKETVIYLDNSFSMQAKSEQGTLLDKAVQELIKTVPEEENFNLFTNTSEFRNIQLKDIQNDLLTIIPTPDQLTLDEIQLKADNFFTKNENSIKNLVVVSDFQQRLASINNGTISNFRKHLVKLATPTMNNVSLDSIYISKYGTENIEIIATLSAPSEIQSIPVSLFHNKKLIAKTSAVFEDLKGEVNFTLSANDIVNGKVEISDPGITYDNHLFFNINEKEKPKVLAIGGASSEYLRRIYPDNEFLFSSFLLKNLNYRDLESQNLILLNELEKLPTSLMASLSSFVSNDGNLGIIPSTNSDINEYNQFLSRFSLGSFVEKVSDETKITQITFSHPLYENVFEKNIGNFQYPKVSEFFRINSNASKILGYQSGEPFLLGTNGIYLFTASIANKNSNFKQSPLIVPTFYKMGVNSLKRVGLYHTMGGQLRIDIAQKIAKDHILKVAKDGLEFIPQQRAHANKVSLTFNENPFEDGIYNILENENILKKISFNYPRDESEMKFLDINTIPAASKQSSIAALFQDLENDNSVTELWKWFVILAVLFILMEMLIIKYLK
ncbi:MAG: BatA domain-containing protein [Maribacter sp.]